MFPKPGDHTIQYTATMHNRGGQQFHRTIKSSAFRYMAVSGPPVSCQLHGWPEKKQLGTLQNGTLHVVFKDSFGNCTKPAVAPQVVLSSAQLEISCEVGQWRKTEEGADRLQLAAVVVKPMPAFQLPGAGQSVACDVTLRVTLDRGLQLSHNYKMDVFAGMGFVHNTQSTFPCRYNFEFSLYCCVTAIVTWQHAHFLKIVD